MSRNRRPVTAINESTGERKDFSGLYEAAKAIGSGHVQILYGMLCNQAVRGWRFYDSPAKIRERIKELEDQLKMLEG